MSAWPGVPLAMMILEVCLTAGEAVIVGPVCHRERADGQMAQRLVTRRRQVRRRQRVDGEVV